MTHTILEEDLAKKAPKKFVFHTKHEKFDVWKIANRCGFNPENKTRFSEGFTVLATVWNEKPNKLYFQKLNYEITKGSASGKEKVKCLLSIVNGQLNLYCIDKFFEAGNKKFVRKVRNFSTKSDLLNKLKIKKKSEITRIGRAINEFLKRNKFPRLLDRKGLTIYNFNGRMLQLIYPGLKGGLIPDRLSFAYSREFRRGDIKTVIKKCYGYDSKKLVKLVCESINKNRNFALLDFGLLIKGLINLDNIHNILSKSLEGQAMGLLAPLAGPLLTNTFQFKNNAYNWFRAFIKLQSPARRLGLIRDASNYLILDVLRMYNQYVDIPEPRITITQKWKTWEEIHNMLTIEINKLNNPNIIFEYSDKYKAIDGLSVDNLRIELPADSYRLADYGKELHHCVASYGNRVKDGDCRILAIYKDNKLKYNVEIRGRGIQQLRGLYNCEPDPGDREKLEELLLQHEIIRNWPPIPQVPICIRNWPPIPQVPICEWREDEVEMLRHELPAVEAVF